MRVEGKCYGRNPFFFSLPKFSCSDPVTDAVSPPVCFPVYSGHLAREINCRRGWVVKGMHKSLQVIEPKGSEAAVNTSDWGQRAWNGKGMAAKRHCAVQFLQRKTLFCEEFDLWPLEEMGGPASQRTPFEAYESFLCNSKYGLAVYKAVLCSLKPVFVIQRHSLLYKESFELRRSSKSSLRNDSSVRSEMII